MKKNMLALLLCFCILTALMACCAYAETAAAEPETSGVEPFFAVYSYATERIVYELDSTTAPLSLNQGENYLAFCFKVSNYDTAARSFKNVYATIDGGDALYWNDFSLNSGESTILHIFNVHMKNVTPGIHAVNFYANGQLFTSALFTMNRDWSKSMTIPTEEQLYARNISSRECAPYASASYSFAQANYHQLAVDFKADYLPDDTFICPISWNIDTSSLKDSVMSIDANRTAYAGFQTTDNGTYAVMYIKDAGYTDKNGNPGVIRARLTYSNPYADYVENTESGDYSGNGVAASCCRVSYNLQPGHWYRALIEYSTNTQTGNTSVQYMINDLTIGEWVRLMEFDLGMKNTYISSFGSFVENSACDTSGNVRTLELTNARALKEDSWQPAVSVTGSIGTGSGLVSSGATSGSYAYYCDGSVFGMITSGVAGLGSANNGTEFKITSCETGSPF